MAVEPGGIATAEAVGASKAKGCIRSWKPWTWHTKRGVIYDMTGIPSAEAFGTPEAQADLRMIYGMSGIATVAAFGTPSVFNPDDYDWLLVDYADRIYPWGEYCGIPGGIPVRETVYTTLYPGATAAQINAAIAACPVGQVVVLAAGTYNLGSTRLTPKSGVTLRGAGPGQTLIQSSVYHCINYDGHGFAEANGIAIASGYTKGSMSITLSSAPSALFVAGRLMTITQNQSPNAFETGIGVYGRDGLTDSIPSLTPSRIPAFVTRIDSVSGNTITFATPLPFTYTAGLSPQAYPQSGSALLSQFGVESMTFDGCGDPVIYYSSDRCWFLDIDFDACPGCDRGAVVLLNSVQPEIRRCYVHDVPDWPATNEGMGFGAIYGTCNGLFVNNISNRTSSQFIIEGASANAFVYNYAIDCSRGGTPVVMPQFSFHGPHPIMNLFEGNIGPQHCPDGYHGSSSHDMIFRNHFNGLCTGRTNDRWIMNLGRGSYYESVVGNILGDASWEPDFYQTSPPAPGHDEWTIWRLGYPNSGSGSMTPETVWSTHPNVYPDAAVESTLLRHGNFDYHGDAVVWREDIASHSIPASLFYDSKPDFFGYLTWPPIGPDVTGLVTDIPAKSRWDAYGLSADIDDLFISNTYWVSSTGAAAWADARSESPLSGVACCSLATALANAAAGDVVYIRTGLYDRSLQPANSGTAGAPITFMNYPGETPTFTVLDDAHGRWGLYLRLRNYIRVVGIRFSGCLAFYAIYGSSYNEVTECEFTTSGGFLYSTAIICDTTLGLEWGGTPSSHNWVHHNTFTRYGAITSGGDDLGTVRIGAGYRDTSAYNTFEDNEFSHGGHDLLDVGAPYSVVRRNVFHNEESYFADNGAGTNSPTSGYFGNRCIILSNSGWTGYPGIPMHCLIEENRIGHSGTPPDDDGAFGIETAGYHTIIRFNDIFNTAGSGLYLKAQPDPSYYCSDAPDAPDPHGPGNVYKSGSYTRAYNNTLYHCGFGDADISTGFKYGVQVHGIVGATYYPPTGYCRAHPTHGYNFSLDWPWPLSVSFKNNIVYDYNTGEYAFAASSAGQVTYENNWNTAAGNPLFVNGDISDPTSLTLPNLALQPGSPCIGAGTHLTLASGAGIASTTLVVDDARYFQDGTWGSALSDMRPDWIAIGTASNVVEIESIDYDTNTITLATPMTWSNNDPIHLYKDSEGTVVLTGAAPNIGAH